jgi:hypothetical protein
MTKLASYLSLLVGFSLSASATTTLQFSQTGIGVLAGLSNNAGLSGVNGMQWGIVYDTGGDGFGGLTFDSSGYLSAATGTTGYNVFSLASGFLSGNTSATNDYFYVPVVIPTTQNRASISGVDPGGDGAVLSLTGAFNNSDAGKPAGLNTGDRFAIIWFEAAPVDGSYYGMFSPSVFQTPASGATLPLASNFTNGNVADPIQPASLQFGAIPEPSRLVLLGIGFIGLFARRRR